MYDTKITVFIPVLNMKETVERAILSVLEQDYENKELIVLDGGSTDGTIDIIKKYLGQIHFFKSEQDDGASRAIAGALSHANGTLIGAIGADDWYEEGALKAVAHAYEMTQADVVYGDINIAHDDGSKKFVSMTNTNLENLYFYGAILTPATLVKKEHLVEYYDFLFRDAYKKIHIASDQLLWLKLYHSGKKFAYIPSETALTNFSRGGRSDVEFLARWDNYIVFGIVTDGDPETAERYGRRAEGWLAMNMLPLYLTVAKEGFLAECEKLFFKEKRYVLFGTGYICSKAAGILDVIDVNIDYFIDNYTDRMEKDGKEIFRPEKLKGERDCVVLLASFDYENEMREQLEGMDLDESVEILSFMDLCVAIKRELGMDVLIRAWERGEIR